MRPTPGTLFRIEIARGSTSKEEAVEAIAEHHNIPLDEFNGLTAEEAREQIIQELQIPFQTQGYTTNYDIEVWLVNDWA